MPALSRRKRVSIGIPSRRKREHSASGKRERSSSRNRNEKSLGKKEVPVNNNAGFAEDQVPLKVFLPPTHSGNATTELLTMDEESLREILKEKKLDISDSTTDDNNKKLNVEEFECGVSIAGSEKQEWSFTLYDFDGHGKITKEDLASLLKSLYDAVGSSINLPQNGTKTLKLRLTVSPDNAKVDSSKNNNIKTQDTSKLNKDRDNCKLSTKENKLSRKDSPSVKQNNITKAERERLAELKHTLFAQDYCAKDTPTSPRLSGHTGQVRNNLSPGGATETGTKATTRCRMSLGEQQELADLVRENMERNLSRTKHVRRHHSDQRAARHKPRHGGAAQESQDRRNYYLDLAGIENTQTETLAGGSIPIAHLNTTAPATMLHVPITHRERHMHKSPDTKTRSRSHNVRVGHFDGHSPHRSRSHEVSPTAATPGPMCCPVVERTLEEEAEEFENSPRSPRLQPKSTSTPKTQKFRPVSLPAHVPETASPHHHRRHRHRERNHKIAMQNVAEWIEREHSLGGDRELEPVIVQKHEHHHVHEHHHHHHHHYHQS